MPNFEEFNRHARPTRSEPIVTIQTKGLFSLNQAAYEALGRPEFVVLLMDPHERVMAFRPANEGQMNSYRVRQPSQASRSYAVSGKAFCVTYDIDTEEKATYPAEKQGDLLTVDLKKPAK